ncbi:DUF1833 family protein [Mesorhizobium sp. 8]|uniref:DUF1833 family protein n=1 Tax=Mesorhizobium sp. 8 TaxID=2584466 RepID=UPI0015D66B0B|nr:DUF1833 family protein [Mesorhizobium sp. 8]
MSKPISLNALRQVDAPASDQVAVFLVIIEHDALERPLRLSSDNTSRITIEPLTYGTWSTYGSEDSLPEPFYYIGMEVIPPDDEEDAEPTSTIVIDVLDADIVGVLTSTTVPAAARIAIVMADTPNLVEIETVGLQLKNASGDWGQIALKLSMEDLYDEPFPAMRMTKERFPGLHR